MKSVRLSTAQWPGVRASRAVSFLDRLVGIRSRGSGNALLIGTRSIHTLGLDRPLRVLGLDEEMRVIESRLVPPNRVAFFPGASFVLELSGDEASIPVSGSRLEISDV